MDENAAIRPGHLDIATWELIQRSIPIPVVDVFPIRRDRGEVTHIGLLRRPAPNELGYAWSHIGGRMLLGEDIADTIERLAVDATGVSVRDQLDDATQPEWVAEYKQADIDNGEWSSRNHAIALLYALEFPEDTTAATRGEVFGWFEEDEVFKLPLWPGTLEGAVQFFQ